MSLLVVDENGEIESVAIYNYKCNDVDLSHLVPTGTKVIIKEPYLKSFACDKGEYFFLLKHLYFEKRGDLRKSI